MKLKTCLEMGNACGLKLLGECLNNIFFHADAIFRYDEIKKECNELEAEANEIYDIDTPIDAIVDANNWEWYYKTEEDKLYGMQFLREKICIPTLRPSYE